MPLRQRSCMWVGLFLAFLCSCGEGREEVYQSQGVRYSGFAVFGPHWKLDEQFETENDRLMFLKEQGYLTARHTSNLNANMVRMPISIWTVLGSGIPVAHEMRQPAYQMAESVAVPALGEITEFLKRVVSRIEKNQSAWGEPLNWGPFDAFLDGVHSYNVENAEPAGVAQSDVVVTVVLTEPPPSLILEASSRQSRAEAWELYCRLHKLFARKVVQRYGRGYARRGVSALWPVAAAVEMFNEPDYAWLPDELKIEQALNPHAYPCHKYVTQLYLSQIPVNDLPAKGCTRRGSVYVEQNLSLPHAETALDNFKWGAKFDYYVERFATLHESVSLSVKEEIASGGADMLVVSSAVTHVNIDWFRHMFRANPNTFRYVDRIAVHPYHWPGHDIHDAEFVDGQSRDDWLTENPRKYARDYFKRFDFIHELAALVKEPDNQKSFGMSGKLLWVTEFGIPTKKVNKVNLASFPKKWNIFIYDRATPIPETVKAIIWEDKWNAFFRQARKFLSRNQVEAFLIYTLREATTGEANDSEHSNFSIYSAEWRSRLNQETLERLAHFLADFRKNSS